MKSWATKFLFVFLNIFFLNSAFAMNYSLSGDTLTMSGGVSKSDCGTLGDYIRNNKIQKIILSNSNGGDANSGYCIGELIRNSGISTAIKGKCASSCSRIWLGGVKRELIGSDSKVGLHGNYDHTGTLKPDAPSRLRAWLPQYAPSINAKLMEEWINLPKNTNMMYFYNDRAELCDKKDCKPVKGFNVKNAGLAK